MRSSWHQCTVPGMLAQVKLQHAADEPRDRTQQVAEPLAEADEDAATDEVAEALRTESMSFLLAFGIVALVCRVSPQVARGGSALPTYQGPRVSVGSQTVRHASQSPQAFSNTSKMRPNIENFELRFPTE